MIGRRITHAAMVAASVGVIAAAGHVDAAHSSPAASLPVVVAPAWMSRPCPVEDSTNCAWDASTRGNAFGHSFVVRRLPGSRMVCVFYVDARYAATHDRCEVSR